MKAKGAAATSAALVKNRRPELSRTFARVRLFALIEDFAQPKMIWVEGPPGAGKTTLVATYLESQNATTAWLHIDRADSDPATFFHFLSRSLTTALRGRVRPPKVSTDDLNHLTGFARRWMRRLTTAIAAPVTLVLDNYQELGTDSPVHAAIAAALEEQPRNLRWVVISRTPPPAVFARPQAAQAIRILNASDLQFSVEETEALLELHGKAWTPRELRDTTDGWVAGMILMLASNRVPDASNQNVLAKEKIFDYFAAEVVARMTETDQRILMCVAFLPSATEAMAELISAEVTAGRLLSDLAKQNLFVTRRVGAEPVFVLHALLGEFLRNRALSAFDPQFIKTLRRAAGRLLAEHGEPDAAIEQYIAAADWEAVGSFLEMHAGDYLASGRTMQLRSWIDTLPETIRCNASTLYWSARAELAQHPERALPLFVSAFDAFEEGVNSIAVDSTAADSTRSMMAAAGAAEAVVAVGAEFSQLDRWIAYFDSVASRAEQLPDSTAEMAILPGMLAAFVYRRPEHPLTAILADRAEQLIDASVSTVHPAILGCLAFYITHVGTADRVGRIIAAIDRIQSSPDIASSALLRWFDIKMMCKIMRGDVDGALADAARARSLTVPPALAHLQARVLLREAQALLAVGAKGDARRQLEAAGARLQLAHKFDRAHYEFVRGLIAREHGDFGGAVDALQAMVDGARAIGTSARESIALIVLAQVAAELGDYERAERALQEVATLAFHQVCSAHQWHASIVEAYLAYRQGHTERCIAALGRGLGAVRRDGYGLGLVSTFGRRPLAALCAIALTHDIEIGLVRDLIRRFELPPPTVDTEHWPWRVRLMSLGRFAIERDGEAYQGGRKENRRPLDALKVLLAATDHSVNANHLTQLLWPDTLGDAARNALDSALHRLRKILGADDAVLVRNGTVTLNPATCWTDVRSFERTIVELSDHIRAGGSRGRLDELTETLLARYVGEFLPGDDELTPVLAARERLRGRFVRHVTRIGGHLEELADWERAVDLYRRVLEQDPLAEEIYRRLIRCYVHLERPAEAFDVYRRCRSKLSVVLGRQPSAETESLVARLRSF